MIALLADIAFILAFVGFATFSLLYALRSPWRSTAVGRNAMAFMVVCALLLGLGIWRLVLGDPWFNQHRDLLRLISYGLIVWVVWWRVWLLVKLQRDDNDDQKG